MTTVILNEMFNKQSGGQKMITDNTQNRVSQLVILIEQNTRLFKVADTFEDRKEIEQAVASYSREYLRLTGKYYRVRERREE